MAQWWIVSVNFGIPYVTETTNPTTIPGITGESGPFPTQAAAEKFLPHSGLGSGGSGGSGGGGPIVVTGNPVNPSQPINGVVTNPNKYPQWGVNNPSGNLTSKGDVIAEAHNAAEKNKLLDKGYFIWFVSRAAAEAFIASENSPFNGNLPSPLGGLDAIGAFFSTLAEPNLWKRVGYVGLGVVLLAIGVAKLTNAVPIATKIAKTAGVLAI